MYKSTSKVNDLFPEIPTIIFLSALLFLNVGSILLVFDISIEGVGLNRIYLIVTIILFFNFYYFLKNDKYRMIIEEYESKKNVPFLDVLIFIYPFASFFICFKLLKMANGQIGFTLMGLLFVEVLAYISKKKD